MMVRPSVFGSVVVGLLWPAALVITVLIPLSPGRAAADALPISVDGLYDDWGTAVPVCTDPAGDAGTSGIDLGRLWLADDHRFLFLRMEVGTDLDLDENNRLAIYLDTDNNSATGLQVGDIGAELEWIFGQRQGTYHFGAQSTTVYQDDLRFRAIPTVSSTVFEAAFGRDMRPDGIHDLFPGPTVRMILRDTASGGDNLPDGGASVSYTFDQGSLPPETPVPFSKERPGDVRFISWNVHMDSPWVTNLQPKFQRLIQAMRPQVLCFQEIYNHTPQQTASLIETWLPSGPGETWYSADNNDCQVISRYPVINSWPLDGNLAVLLNTVPLYGRQTLVLSCHLPCCTDDAGRQAEVDRILSFLRDAHEPAGQLTLDGMSPIVVCGDMNFVGSNQPLRSLVTGDVINEHSFGPDVVLDWDGTGLADLVSRQTEKRMGYTWRSDAGTFWPGRLDFWIYTDAAFDVGRHYVVYTPEMSPDSLTAHGLLSTDSEASDHLPHCADFRLPSSPASVEDGSGSSAPQASPTRTINGGSADGAGSADRLHCSIWPNPSTGGATFTLDAPHPIEVKLEIYNPAGRMVASPTGSSWVAVPAGPWRQSWSGTVGQGSGLLESTGSGRALAPGTYFVRMRARDGGRRFESSTRWVVIR